MSTKSARETPLGDIRVLFASMDKSALLNAREVAAIAAFTTPQAVYYRVSKGTMPEPRMRENKAVRWSVGDVRDWLERMQPQPVKLEKCYGVGKRPGRPRKTMTANNVNAK